MDKAVDKLRDEMAKHTGDAGIAALGEYLTTRLMENPGIAEKILADGKTIAGAFNTVREYARKNQKGGFCAVSDEKAYEITCQYFGIDAQAPAPAPAPAAEKTSADEIDLDALLGEV